MDRTLRAALLAALIGLLGVGGMAAFLGLPAGTSVVGGVVSAVLFGGIVLAAARRAEHFEDTGER